MYATTRNLYGADRAAVVTGLVALEPSLVWVTGIGLSETFSLLFATLTVWAFLRSLADLRWILPAGLFWTAVYLRARAPASSGWSPPPPEPGGGGVPGLARAVQPLVHRRRRDLRNGSGAVGMAKLSTCSAPLRRRPT